MKGSESVRIDNDVHVLQDFLEVVFCIVTYCSTFHLKILVSR